MSPIQITMPMPTSGLAALKPLEKKVAKVESAVFDGRLTVVVVTMANGYLVTGESCRDSSDGFNEVVGFEVAFTRAMEKAMQLEGYANRAQQKTTEELPEGIEIPY